MFGFDMEAPRLMCAYCLVLAADPAALVEADIPGSVIPPDRERIEPGDLPHAYWSSMTRRQFYIDRSPVGVVASTRVAGTDVCLGHVLVAMERAGLKPVQR